MKSALGATLDLHRELLGVGSTASLFVNDRLVSGAQPYDGSARIIDEELARVAHCTHSAQAVRRAPLTYAG